MVGSDERFWSRRLAFTHTQRTGAPLLIHEHHIQILWSALWFTELCHVCHLRAIDPGP